MNLSNPYYNVIIINPDFYNCNQDNFEDSIKKFLPPNARKITVSTGTIPAKGDLPDLVILHPNIAFLQDEIREKLINSIEEFYRSKGVIFTPFCFLYDLPDKNKISKITQCTESMLGQNIPFFELNNKLIPKSLNNLISLKRATETSLQGDQLVNVLLDAIEGKEKAWKEQKVSYQELNDSVNQLLSSKEQWYIYKIQDEAKHQILLCSRDKMEMVNSEPLKTGAICTHLLKDDWTFIESDSKKNTKIFKLLY